MEPLSQLTKSTAVQFHSHGNVTTPCFGMDAHVTRLERATEPMRHYIIPLEVSAENLAKK